jgi:hypothetical protein
MLTTVFVPKPPEISLGEAMNRLRLWFDSKKMQPYGFKIATDDRPGFEIMFSSEQAAAQLENFVWSLNTTLVMRSAWP